MNSSGKDEELQNISHYCDICEKSFKSSSGLYQHQRNKHGVSYEISHPERNLVCPNCDSVIPSKVQLEKHFLEEHNIKFVKENLIFPSEKEFLEWKKEVERATSSAFKKKCGAKINNGIKKDYYYCFRSGNYTSKGKGERNLKILGSNKINSVCPAMMKVIYAENISVDFTKTHIGHECEVGRLQLTEEEKQNVASKLASNVSIDAILDEIRDNFSDKLGRLDLLTRRDVHNIKHQFNLHNEGINHINDAESVKIWVNSFKNDENSPIIYFKIQGEIDNNFPCLESKDFMLILMNDIQKDMLNMYGNDVITVDFTHGMNPYNFDLATILVIDHKREGFPAAFIFSNRQDSIALKVAFQNIKSSVNMNIKPKVFMSDDCESFYNAWCSVFAESENRLLCTWHIDKAWRKNIEKLIKNKDDQIIVYKTLRCLMSETDIDAFVLMHQNFLNYLQNNEITKDFSKYFISTYSNRCQMWAYCYRKWAGINTNMHIERMHRSIKYIYLKGRKARRLDMSIHALMKFLKDKVVTQLIALKRGKISSKLSNLRKRHIEADNLSKDKVIKQGEGWIVSSSTSDELYTVNYNGPCSQSCALKCTHCSHCIHNYQCTCIDNSIQWNMCKHIHLVCIITKSVEEDEKNLIIEEDYVEPLKNKEEKILEKLNLKEKKNLENVMNYKQSLSKFCAEMIESCSTMEECEELMKRFKNVQASFMGYKTISKKVPPSKRAFPLTVSEPHNKRIKRQGFFSTKKKLQRSKKILNKPSRKEILEISNTLIFNDKYKIEDSKC